MATGAIFQLLSNDGKQDRIITASQLLNSRLTQVRAKRGEHGLDETPTLLDIEKTHVLFTNAHFKPFVALGYEYNKVSAGSGNIQLGGEVQFSIPQFGDFFADMVLMVNIAAPTLSSSYTGVNEPLVRWCEYPGERITEDVTFEVNGNPLDSYNYHAAAMHRKFMVQPNKKLGWDMCMGQQVPMKGTLDVDGYTSANAGSTWSQSTPNGPTSVGHAVEMTVLNGPQTPKSADKLESLSLMIPLLFWCNKDFRLAVPSVAIPYGQRFIKVKLASKDKLVGLVGRGTSAGASAMGTLSDPKIDVNLYINNFFVNPEIHRIFIRRIGFSLIRVHRFHESTHNTSSGEALLQSMKWPIETMFVGLRPQAQESSLANWHKFDYVENQQFELPQLATTGTVFTGAVAGAVATVTPTYHAAVVTVPVGKKTIDKLSITAHGIDLYKDLPSEFFHHYTTYTFGGPNVRVPEDDNSALMIPFNLYPGTYQPSGHINVSRAREFYFKFTSSVIGSVVASGKLVIVASAINFLLISDGSAVLRYTT